MKTARELNKPTYRNAEISTISSAFQDMLLTYNLENKYQQTLLLTKWEQIVGGTVATRTEKITFKDKTMFVYLTSAPLKHELNFSKNKLIELINETLKTDIINEIVFL